MAEGNRANENDGTGTGYELGDLEIVRTGRASGEQPVSKGAETSAGGSAASSSAMSGRGLPRNLTLAEGDMGPALELDLGGTPNASRIAAATPATVQVRAPGQPPPTPSNQQTAAARGATSPLDDFEDGGFAKLPALDVQKRDERGAAREAPAPSFGSSSPLDDFDDGGLAKLPTLDVQKVEKRSAERVAVREPPAADPLAAEREEALATQTLARFPAAPGGWFSSVPYTFRVVSRILALRSERAAAHEEQQKRGTEHQAALVAFGLALLQKATDKRMDPLRSHVARVHDERAKLERAEASTERTREGNERALGLLRSEAEHLREQLSPYFDAEKEAEAAQRKANDEVRRAQAMLKRVEIEMRALDEATTPPDPARIATLEAQLEQRRGVLGELNAKLTQATEALGKARRELALARGTLDANEEKQKRLQAEARAREAEAMGQQRAATGAYESALCELAEAGRKQRLDTLAPEEAAKTKSTEAALEEARLTAARFDRALTLYDRNALIRGVSVVVGLAAALIALLILK